MRVRYAIVKGVTVKDSKGNATKSFEEINHFYGSYIAPVTKGKAEQYGFNGETEAKLVTRFPVEVNSFIKHNSETFHVIGVLSVRDVHSLLLKKVR